MEFEQSSPVGALRISFVDIRRERTGVHAAVFIGLFGENGHSRSLGHDTFNITRSEDRGRLVRAARKQMPSLAQEAFGEESLINNLNGVTAWVAHQWETERYGFTEFDPDTHVTPPPFVLDPYIVEDGGTILFAKGGSGKSYLAMAMAACITRGIGTLWGVTQVPVLYVNLERSPRSLEMREQGVRQALGVKGASGISYLHARGKGLRAIARSVRAFTARHSKQCLVIMDSISRAQLGSLNTDETANELVDTLNGLGCAWLGIGHVPRDSADHTYGSVHFDNGQDIGVKAMADGMSKPGSLGMVLTIVKANDLPKTPPSYYALDFDDRYLVAVRRATHTEFPELADEGASVAQRISRYIQEQPGAKATTTDVAEALALNPGNVSRELQKPMFVRLPKEGRDQPYGVQERQTE